MAETIKEKKIILASLEIECQELNARSEKLFAFEEFVQNIQAQDGREEEITTEDVVI